jgi:copper(I)-binding protein
MPSTINIPDKGMVFINGKSAENWKWMAVKAIEIPKEEKSKFPEGNTHKMDMGNAKEFEEKDFMEALSYIGLLP